MGNKRAFQERQLAIAIERGLVPAPKGHIIFKERPGVNEYPTVMRKAEAEPEPVFKNPCEGCDDARMKLKEGWCIHGRFWTHGEIHVLKHLKALAGPQALKTFTSPAILAMKDALGGEFVSVHVDVR